MERNTQLRRKGDTMKNRKVYLITGGSWIAICLCCYVALQLLMKSSNGISGSSFFVVFSALGMFLSVLYSQKKLAIIFAGIGIIQRLFFAIVFVLQYGTLDTLSYHLLMASLEAMPIIIINLLVILSIFKTKSRVWLFVLSQVLITFEILFNIGYVIFFSEQIVNPQVPQLRFQAYNMNMLFGSLYDISLYAVYAVFSMWLIKQPKAYTTKEKADNATISISSPNTTANSNGTENQIEALEKLAKLHQEGILTDEEFNQKKADLLSKM